MQPELKARLRQAQRRILLTRAVEAAGVGAAVGGLCAGAAGAACLAASVSIALAMATACVPLALVALAAIRPGLVRRLGLSRLLAGFVIAACVVSSLAIAAVIAAGFSSGMAALPPAITGFWVAAGAVAALVRGVSVSEAAVLLDLRLGLGERLSTAVELSQGPAACGPLARTVDRQALAAMKTAPPPAGGFWRRGRATAGAAGLGVLLSFVAACGLAYQDSPRLAGLQQALAAMSPAEQAALADTLRAAARREKADAPSQELMRAAGAIEARDARQLQEIIETLKRLGFHPATVLPPQLLAAANPDRLAAGGESPAAADPAAGNALGIASAATFSAPRLPAHSGPAVHVYDPHYAKFISSNAALTTAPAGGKTADGAQGQPIADNQPTTAEAWSAAQARAARALAAGQVPPEDRETVRKFFAVGQ